MVYKIKKLKSKFSCLRKEFGNYMKVFIFEKLLREMHTYTTSF